MNQSNIAQYIKSMNLIYLVLLVGQVCFGVVVWWFLNQWKAEAQGVFSKYGMLAFIILVWMAFSSFLLYRKRTARGAKMESLPLKLMHYRTSCIFRWAMLEFANIAVIMLAFVERNSSIMLLFALGIAVFLLTRPGEDSFKSDYEVQL